MISKETVKELEEHARRIRIDSVTMYHHAGYGHFGGSMSCADIIALLYFKILNIDPQKPDLPDRDRFIISKGHSCSSLYSALNARGFFPREWIDTYGELCAHLNTHPSMDRVTGLDISSGSLGLGLSVGVGMALAAKLNKKSYKTFVLLGDGECNEGMIWEAAMAAPHYKLDNLIAIIDRNYLCVTGNTEDVLPLEPFAQKWRSFGWDVMDVNGHDFISMDIGFDWALYTKNNKPKVIIAHTVKGKGISFMENDCRFHSASISDKQFNEILKELKNER